MTAIIIFMRRFLLILALTLLSCRTLSPGFLRATPTFPAAQPIPTSPQPPAPTVSLATPAVSPTPTESPTYPAPTPPGEEQYAVRYHPDGGLFVGDQVSIEVIAPQGENLSGRSVEVRITGNPDVAGEATGQTLPAKEFSGFGIGNRQQATLQWAWDTSLLAAGPYTFTYSILPSGPIWTETVALRPAEQVPPPQPQAQWATTETDCCVIYYITGTAAERDLAKLIQMADEQAQDVNRRLGIDQTEPILITFLPRVLGHGGFTSSEISVSYLDRNYAGSSTETVLHHEIVHWQDSYLGGEFRPTLFVEGLAVYLTGGHFKPEPLLPRAAALLEPGAGCGSPTTSADQDLPAKFESSFPQAAPQTACGLDWYLSLRDLADNFYTSQHEIGYLQAGSLIEYMVDTWGWETFSGFYRDMQNPENMSQAEVIDAGLQKHFKMSLEQLEVQFLEALRQQPLTPSLVEDVRLTIQFYDTIRRYQKLLDPSAYFLTAWLPDGKEMRSRGIVADYVRRPSAPENIAIETLLVGADSALRLGDYSAAARLLASTNAMLDVFEGQAAGTHPPDVDLP